MDSDNLDSHIKESLESITMPAGLLEKALEKAEKSSKKKKRLLLFFKRASAYAAVIFLFAAVLTNLPNMHHTQPAKTETEIKKANGTSVLQNTPHDITSSQKKERSVITQNNIQADKADADEEALRTLSSYFRDEYNYKKVIADEIHKQMQESDNPDFYTDEIYSIFTGDESFSINPDGELIIKFSAGKAAPEDYGELIFNVGKIKDGELIRKEW